MRIGLIIYGSLDTVSGGYLYDRMLVRYLETMGHEIDIVSLPWRTYPRHLSDNFSTAIVDRLRCLTVDVLLQDELNHPSLVRVNRRLRGQVPYPIVSIVHHLRYSEAHSSAWRSIYGQVERAYLRTVNGFVFNSRTTQASVEMLLGRATSGIVAYPAADHLAPPSTESIIAQRRAKCTEQGPLNILFVGNVIPRKGLHRLLAALSRLPQSLWRLKVIGSLSIDHNYVNLLRGQLNRDNLQEAVHLTDSVSDADLKGCLQESHLLAVPSYEGFGIVYLEAMSFGLPVIASTTGAAHEIVTDGENGHLIDPDDIESLSRRILALHQDRTQLLTQSIAARQRYDRHPTWQQSGDRIASWLTESVATSNVRT